MSRHAIIQHTINVISKLPDDKAEEVSEFADFVMKRYEGYMLLKGVQKINADSKSFDFLQNEEDIYTETDLKELYNA